MASDSPSSAPIRIIILLILNILLIYLLSTFLDRIFFVSGGLPAYIIIGSLMTLMNLIVRPVVNLILLPFKFLMGAVILILANAFFLWLTERIAEKMDPGLVVLEIDQGIGGWILVAIILGVANWVFKHSLR